MSFTIRLCEEGNFCIMLFGEVIVENTAIVSVIRGCEQEDKTSHNRFVLCLCAKDKKEIIAHYS